MAAPRTNCLASRGLLQLTALCLLGTAAAAVVSDGSNSPAVKPSPPPVAFQPATVPRSTGIFTFNRPGRSFVEYRHVWPSLRPALRLTVRLRFRTTRPAGVLALLSSVVSTGSNAGVVLPTTLIRLHRGSVHVTVSSSRDQDHVVPAQAGVVVGRGRYHRRC